MDNKGCVLITGGAKRLGGALSVAFAEAGYAIALHYRTDEELANSKLAELRAQNVRAEKFYADFSADDFSADTLILDIQKRLGEITGIINNASLFVYDQPESARPEALEQHYRVNTIAPIALSQSFYRQLITRKSSDDAWVINVLDQKVRALNPDYFSYSTSKYALYGATRMMAMHFAPHLRVCALSPGLILPNAQFSTEQFNQGRQKALLKESGNVTEITRAALFLAQQTTITGETITIDGGQSLLGLTRDVAFL